MHIQATRWSILKTNLELHASSTREMLNAHLPLCRLIEYPVGINLLGVSPGQSMLEIGAGTSPVSIYVANQGLQVCATDINPDSIQVQVKGWEKRLARSRQHEGRFLAKLKNATKLDIAESFSAVICLSVIEHIPGTGDILAVREMSRRLSPYGRLVLSFPYGTAYREAKPPYDTAAVHRIYDESAIESRLLGPSGLRKGKIVYFGWKSDVAKRAWSRLGTWLNRPMLRHLVGWSTLLIPGVLYGIMDNSSHHLAEGAILVLQKS